MTTRTIDKLRALGLAIGAAMVTHDVVVHRAERAAQAERRRRALRRMRPSR